MELAFNAELASKTNATTSHNDYLRASDPVLTIYPVAMQLYKRLIALAITAENIPVDLSAT